MQSEYSAHAAQGSETPPVGPVPVPRRILFLDLARGFAILFMIMQHAVIVFGHRHGMQTLDGRSSPLGLVVLLLGTAPAAPVFMLIMGIFFVRSRSSAVRPAFIRGLRILALGYLLNLMRFYLPQMCGAPFMMLLGKEDSPIDLLLAADILQMAGLSLMLMGVVKRFLPDPRLWLALSFVIVLFSPLLWGRLPGTVLTTPLWGDGENVYFPLFPWIIYPFIGMFIGTRLDGRDDLRHMARQGTVAGIVTILVGVILTVVAIRFPRTQVLLVPGNYSRSGLPVHLIVLGVALIWLVVCDRFTRKLPANTLFSLLHWWSRNVTAVYFIQWTLIGWSAILLGVASRRHTTAVALGVTAAILTSLVTTVYTKWFARRSGQDVHATEARPHPAK